MFFGGTISAMTYDGESFPPPGFIVAFCAMPVLAVGSFMAKLAFIKPLAEHVVTETADAAAFGSHNIARSVAKGLQEGGGLGREVVKIRCRACGELDDEDAKFCSACGKAM